MGSPEDEPGRYDNEGPRHQVTLTEGFWLFDTPCTQALWQAVMGEQPELFQKPDPAGGKCQLARRTRFFGAHQQPGFPVSI
ncbi:MAG: SUMF1/EgtB/PvdO family nonheme iron enzyme [Candidatus Competibacter sp.]